jgi:hypothetical protein
MNLFHFTNYRKLRGISQFGLTVGDVPTDVRRNKGRCGVWLTSSPAPVGHGLTGNAIDKQAIRLTVKIAENAPLLFRWTDWAKRNATSETIAALRDGDGARDETWFVYFGVLPSASIIECLNIATGEIVAEWPNVAESPLDLPGVPSWRRESWHKNLLKKVAKAAQTHRGAAKRAGFLEPTANEAKR